ncbi:MAG: 4-(cytidine 5'-diphospho)-2-C-methyl-D-erythritol kinase [Solirubrobacteraceae bacterium]
MTVLTSERAPAKINLCLYLGPTRPDGRHELVTLFDAVTLFDELEVAAAGVDEVVCEGVEGPNLVAATLAALRDAGWEAPPLRVTITKRIPVAAGMGGGSADAAALLRLAPRLGSVTQDALKAIAAGLGADVPSQLTPAPLIGTGAGETLTAAPGLPPYAVLVLPQPFALSTADVYREADRMGLQRSAQELASLRAELAATLSAPPMVNDLQPAALSLAPVIEGALDAALGAGADDAIVCGSGPTVIGLFWGADGLTRAREGADDLRTAYPAVVAADPFRGGDRAAAANE